MSELSDKYYSKEELLIIAKEKNIPEKYFKDFILFIEDDINQMTNDGELRENEIGQSAIHFAIDYFNKFYKEIRKGHNEVWANLFSKCIEEGSRAIDETYQSLKKIDPAKALKELEIHCKAVGGDDLYIKHFVYLIEVGVDNSAPSPDEQAATYSKLFKEQIKQGKSEIFAHNYADLMAMHEYSELGCYAEAAEYEKSINAGNTEQYARAYAMKIAKYIENYCSSYEEFLKEPYYNIERKKIEEELKHLK